eukprot:6490434-Amphidinium_carterae.10
MLILRGCEVQDVPLLAPQPVCAVAEILDLEQGESDIDPVVDDESDDDDSSPMSFRLRAAKNYHKLSAKVCPELPGCARKQLRTILQALAQTSHNLQVDAFDHVMRYLRCMQLTGHVEGVMMVHHVLYDETPLKLRVSFSISNEEAGTRTLDTQLAKVYVVEQSWSILCLERSADEENTYLLLRANMSPSLRCAATGSAANLASVLSSTWSPPQSARDLCSKYLRLVECDEFPSNLAFERSWQTSNPSCAHLQFACSAHKVHAATRKSFILVPEVIRGVSRCQLVFQQAGFAGAWRKRLHDYVQNFAQLILGTPSLSEHALAHREIVERFYSSSKGGTCPSQKRVSMFQLVKTDLLNGDWRRGDCLEHYCAGPHCCRDRNHLVRKLQKWLGKLASAFHPTILNRANWLQWHESMNFIGLFAGLHHLLQRVFGSMFPRARALDATDAETDPPHFGLGSHPEVINDAEDKAEELRKEAAENMKFALKFLQSNPFENTCLVRIALHPQIQLMKSMIDLSSPDREASHLHSNLPHATHSDPHATLFRITALAKGDLFQRCLQQSLELAQQEPLWTMFPSTERQASELFTMLWRPAATIHELLVTSWRRFPSRTFLLLDPDSHDTVKAEILAAPACVLDPFTLSLRSDFPELKPPCCHVLAQIASHVFGTTWTTESLHARNARRARRRVQNAKMDLPTLGLVHMGTTSPSWLRPLQRLKEELPSHVQALRLKA